MRRQFNRGWRISHKLRRYCRCQHARVSDYGTCVSIDIWSDTAREKHGETGHLQRIAQSDRLRSHRLCGGLFLRIGHQEQKRMANTRNVVKRTTRIIGRWRIHRCCLRCRRRVIRARRLLIDSGRSRHQCLFAATGGQLRHAAIFCTVRDRISSTCSSRRQSDLRATRNTKNGRSFVAVDHREHSHYLPDREPHVCGEERVYRQRSQCELMAKCD
mmetsp:Transcript_6316/g.10423  ORF Transcript_6316/g.10423 Transcript_6316/m.10423 type:complete len:215 (+) Transcript_6316:124-768(+)